MLTRLKIFALATLLLLAAGTAAHAQAIPGMPAGEKKAESVTINPDDLKSLITTLESDTARNDLIKNLKTLSEAEGKTEPAPPAEETMAPLTKTLGVNNFTNTAINRYQAFLTRNDLNSSTVGKLALTGLTLVVGLFLLFLLRRAATKLLYWLDRAVDWMNLSAARLRTYAKVLRTVVGIGILGLVLYTLTLVWKLDTTLNPFEAHWFRSSLGVVINVGVVVTLATLAWEVLNALMQTAFRRVDGGHSPRAMTILPIVRNIIFLVFSILFALVLLSEIGINIVPLLAGAGIVGVAVGFGAQTMVKDFLSGFILILEDVMRVGDVVKVNEFSGTIEKITLRKIQIRGGSGTVFTIPFSAISVIQNMTKDFSTYDFTFTAPFDVDVEKYFATLREVGESMQKDPQYGALILEPLDIWGVDSFTDSGIVIKGKIKTVAGKQWSVQREFNRRRTAAFAKAGLPQAAMPRSFQYTETMIAHDEKSGGAAPKSA